MRPSRIRFNAARLASWIGCHSGDCRFISLRTRIASGTLRTAAPCCMGVPPSGWTEPLEYPLPFADTNSLTSPSGVYLLPPRVPEPILELSHTRLFSVPHLGADLIIHPP